MCQFLLYHPDFVGGRLVLVAAGTDADIALDPHHAGVM